MKRSAESVFDASYKFGKMSSAPWNHSEWSSGCSDFQWPVPVHQDPQPALDDPQWPAPVHPDPQPSLDDGAAAAMAEDVVMEEVEGADALAQDAPAVDRGAWVADEFLLPEGKRWTKRYTIAEDGRYSYSWKVMSTAQTPAN